jgi:hypothetical protein
MPGLTFPQLLAGAIGALLIYAAIKGETPVKIIQSALSGSSGNAGTGGTPGTGGTTAPANPIPPAAKYGSK